ncbi:MAG: YkgJ family cysteine cluster protein [Bacteroidetes bacterium]|nr:YkgJ family cysteine cluster protein [Bacteroidota bacterium]
MECHPGCAACCIGLSISSPIAGMPKGKRAGERCIHLTEQNRCAIFGTPGRPQICEDFKPDPLMCGSSMTEALRIMKWLEGDTQNKIQTLKT